MIHVVFNEADVTVLQQAQSMDETLAGEVVLIRDDYAVGPLENIYLGEGKDARKQWWSEVLVGGDYEGKTDEVDDYATLASLVGTMRRDESELIWIWAAQNKHDVSGYYWILPYMQEFQGRVSILYLNNLPFINEKGGIFYPQWLSDIPAREFLKAKKLAREITLSEFEVDPDEWRRICTDGKFVRILEGGKKLASYDVDFYDVELRKAVTGDWQKASRVINQVQTKGKHSTGDAFLLWRIKILIQQGEFDMQGKLAGMKDFEVKNQSGIAATEES
jgi:hypothetical protein